MKSFFINEAFDKAINDYINSKDKKESILYNSFLVVVIRLLVVIYGELDIMNPFKLKNEEALCSNLMKYGATEEDIKSLIRYLEGFYLTEKRNNLNIKREFNNYFIDVQKKLIDLFTIKRLNYDVTEMDCRDFFDLLYTPGTSNYLRLSYNFKEAENIYEIAEYYKNAMEKKKEVEEDKKDLLGFDVYKLFNYSIADLSKMNSDEIDKVNSEIYEAFDISENAINKDYLLKEKVKIIKMKDEPLTTGNGYVDILLIMSVIVTTIMVVIIFSTLVF